MKRDACFFFIVSTFTILFLLAPAALSQPLTGTLTIGGAEPDYATFNTAITALNTNGVGTGGVIFEVRSGTYAERCSLGVVAGTSEFNQVVFHATSGNVTINSSSIAGGAMRDVVKFKRSSWITFDGIDVTDNASTNGITQHGFALYADSSGYAEGAQHITIMNSTITLNRTNDSTVAIYCGHYPDVTTDADNSYNRFLNLRITNTNHGILLDGGGATYSHDNEIGSTRAGTDFAQRTIIGSGAADDIGSHGSYCIYAKFQNNLSVHDIDARNVYNNSESVDSYQSPIQVSVSMQDFSIYRCRVHNARNATTGAISMNGMRIGSSGGTVYLYDNFVYNYTNSIGTSSPTGVYLRGILIDVNNSGTINVDNNTVVTDHNSASMITSCVSTNGTGSVYTRSNILANRTTGQAGSSAAHRCLSGVPTTSDHNLFYLPDTVNGYFGYSTTGVSYGTLPLWQALGLDSNSRSGNPLFVDTTANLHVSMGMNSPAEQGGLTVAWVTTDIDSQLRLSPPTIGADEVPSRATIQLIKPNGGETFAPGIADTIKWQSAQVTGNVRIELNRNYPTGNWTTLFNSVPDNGAILWTPALPITTHARIRVMSIDSTIAGDTSSTDFSIGTFTLTLIRPNGGEVLLGATWDTVRWNPINYPGTVSVRFTSAYPGGQWFTLAAGVPLSASFSEFEVPNIYSSTARVAIVPDSLPQYADTSDGDFSIGPFTLTVLHPNGGESLVGNTRDSIRWNQIAYDGTATIRVTLNYPDGPWSTVATNVPMNIPARAWTIPNISSSTARIAVVPDSLPGLADTSDNNFTTVRYALSILHPNGGDTLYAGTQDTIRWVRNNASGNAILFYTPSYPTFNWITVSSSVNLNNLQYVWTVPSQLTNTARIRIMPTAASQYTDTSDANFTVATPFVKILHPNGGEQLWASYADTIRWVPNLARGNATIRLYSDINQSWSVVANSVPLDAQSYIWTPLIASNAKIAIVPDTMAQLADTSDSFFSIGNIGVASWERAIPTSFGIANLYPNPFNSELNVSIAIPRNGKLDIEISDILGRAVGKLYSGMAQAGYLSRSWNSNHLGSGVYFIRARYGNEQIVKKVLYLK